MNRVRWTDDEQEVDFIPVFVIGFEEEFERGVVITTSAYEILDEAEPEFALFAIDAAVDMLMQRRDKIEKRELH
jgi:hypothetical protein